ncbi:hypothetical protein COT99_02025 [Candidatus Falkowbacteria bacterium CG10_big_fil_rev_8_21_14_0_10_43_10]|uniref:PDZ domain-containing protein n=1 Tax=Candidatus Falkowbacteria bacterium CG10_big_fil_rev_8_21_14_0_10_43_10 TaxID=1974567 RepID=A0A2H0V2A5_9BACT|nr:MAG: hypothetical protein COT99_02025 [Candidatus Falkowbacteria bacterium CG10_big_fil_rev_8_21_14_0_10_43_10]
MSKRYKITILIISILLSLLGGIIGGVLVRSYFVNSPVGIPLFGDINLGREYQPGSVIISQPKKVVVEQDDRLRNVIDEVQRKIVDLYVKKDTSQAEIKFNINNYYLPKDRAGEGLILTNDGWIVTPVKVGQPGGFIAVDHEGKIIDIEESFFDKESGYYFIKAGSRNLAAAQFAEDSDISAGQMLVAIGTEEAQLAHIENASYYNGPLVKSSERFYRFIKIDNSLLEKGDIIFNLNSSVVGLYSEKGLITPISQFTNLLPGLLSGKKISRPLLGARYINLSDLIGEEELKGALISRDVNGIATVKSSPAAEAGLKEGDIILEVDGLKIEKDNTLSKFIQGYQAGQEIELKVMRGGEEQINIKVKLGSQS